MIGARTFVETDLTANHSIKNHGSAQAAMNDNGVNPIEEGEDKETNNEQVCEHVPRGGFCQSALRSDPRSEGADTAGLAAVALGLAASNATDTAAFIGRMLGGGGGSLGPAVEQCLSECADQYADAVEQVEASIAAASAGDYGGLRPWVRAAIADAESCEEGFRMEAGGGDQMVMSRRNKVFRLLCDTALRIVELLVLA